MPPILTLYTHLKSLSSALRHPRSTFNTRRTAPIPLPSPILLFYGHSLGELNAAFNVLLALANTPSSALTQTPTILFTSPAIQDLQTISRRLPSMASLLPRHTIRTLTLPLQSPSSLRHFLSSHPIHTAIFIEHRLPHLLISLLSQLKTTLLLLDARLRRPRTLRPFTAPLNAASFSKLSVVTTQAPSHIPRLSTLSPNPIHLATSLKFLNPHRSPTAQSQAISSFRSATSTNPVWIAASTHPPDEPIILAAHAALIQGNPRLKNALLLIAPRLPTRGKALLRRAVAMGFQPDMVCRRSEGHMVPPTNAAVYIADTLGELPIFYSAATVAFIGNSFGRGGEGHNFAEAAHYGVPVIHGPHFSAFAPLTEIVGRVTSQDALFTAQENDSIWRGPCMEANDSDTVGTLVSAALLQPKAANKLGQAFRDAVNQLRKTAEQEVVQLVEQSFNITP